MALDDVLNAGKSYIAFQGKDTEAAVDYHNTYGNVLAYLQNTGRAEAIPENATPEYIGATAKGIRQETESKLMETVAKNYTGVIEELDEIELQHLALNYALPKELRGLAKAVEEGDLKTLKTAYMNEIKEDSVLAYSAAYLKDSDISDIMGRKLRIKTSQFITKNLASEKDGKPVFDKDKAQKYVTGIIERLDDKEKPEAYMILGQMYLQKKLKGGRNNGRN